MGHNRIAWHATSLCLSLLGSSTKVGLFNQRLPDVIMLLIVLCLQHLSQTVIPLPEFSSVKDFTSLGGNNVCGASPIHESYET